MAVGWSPGSARPTGRGCRPPVTHAAAGLPGPLPFSSLPGAALRQCGASRFPAAALPPRFPAEWRPPGSPALPALRHGVARSRSLATVSRWRGSLGAMDVGELLSYQVSGPAAAPGAVGGHRAGPAVAWVHRVGAAGARGAAPALRCRPAGEGRARPRPCRAVPGGGRGRAPEPRWRGSPGPVPLQLRSRAWDGPPRRACPAAPVALSGDPVTVSRGFGGLSPLTTPIRPLSGEAVPRWEPVTGGVC